MWRMCLSFESSSARGRVVALYTLYGRTFRLTDRSGIRGQCSGATKVGEGFTHGSLCKARQDFLVLMKALVSRSLGVSEERHWGQ